jgi:hypothetical protein
LQPRFNEHICRLLLNERNNAMMKKVTVAAALVLVAAAAAPAFASYDRDFGTTTIDGLNVTKNVLLDELHARGINATDADAWGTLVRAEIARPDGSTETRFFTPDNFQPVNVDHRVN